MTKEQIIAKLTEVAGDSAYGKEVVEELATKPFTSEAKYHQDAKDRLDERLGEVKMWARKDIEKGETDKAAVDNANAELIEKMISALE